MDPEIGRHRALLYMAIPLDCLHDQLSQSSASSLLSTTAARTLRKREILAWFIVIIQGLILCFSLHQLSRANLSLLLSACPQTKSLSHFSINGKVPSYHERPSFEALSGKHSTSPFFDPPTLQNTDAGIFSRVWHSNGSPGINNELQTGSCWCSSDEYCMCTPSLAVDVILTSGPDHIWMVQREDTGLMAIMGGFSEVGETVEEAARRELREEMSIDLPGHEISLFGVYSDPMRDKRRHSVSVVFVMDLPVDITPIPGDDARHVHRVSLHEIDGLDMFIDHKTVIRDYVNMRERQIKAKDTRLEPFKRSVCATL